ncbi:hypothetical protein KAM644c_07530 [Klebsiella quasipneumoniae subsp. quasipneumoniae]|uniref:Uncharacterized protein n=1 Tax=Klebsiella quasipneumoniae subsp. quasipneumoniae TaxID=1667327 RepID=A0AAN1Y1X0_9ENTR|nr:MULTISPECIES: hypothetical protein [Klebsiella]MCS6400551.1 hypothetical protein [Klebsiella quasipneumoniae subsp. similipneumoniae]MCS6433666.1 hypothetical protein [Klebsiella pneumoniae]BDO01173.1 hypothetical protein KAM622c_07600 [Klebsiella quasipneumoniae subsp. quasipneumoniae]BDO11687.1 hypothetical protein KAM644c_07530 [Klebsiella quasipneumoniae subsp. quasipneumoniae]BDO17665.1 hypothetical protein KAM645c_07550 [Klebsiella quasipneumoniae subsp. quasipneumoniae]
MKNVANPANAMWPLRFTYRGAVVHITHKGSPLVTWGASVMSINIIPMHLRLEIDRQVREAEKAAEKIAALAAERAAQAECLAVDSPRHVQQNRRRVRNEEQQHYGVSARAVQRKQR